jgi:hypothetical protein
MKGRLGAMFVAAALTFAGGAVLTPASAAPASAPSGTETTEDFAAQRAATATDMSAHRRHYRRYRYVRPYYRPYPYYGYYRPRPYYYQPYYARPYYYNPYPYYRPYRPHYGYGGPFFSFGFGPRYW